MDRNRMSGTARDISGKIEEAVGNVTDDTKTSLTGKIDQATGTAQDLYGQATDAARDTATTLDGWFRRTIDAQPYTTAIVALGVGWLLGRMHRPY